MYGYEIAKQLEVQAEGALPMNQGAALSGAAIVGKERALGERRGTFGFRPAASLLPDYYIGPTSTRGLAQGMDAHQAFCGFRSEGLLWPQSPLNRTRSSRGI